jgi:hypothetical protein
MSTFRHPHTQNERRSDQTLLYERSGDTPRAKARVRSGKSGKQLPTERDDRIAAARRDRGRGQRRTRDHRE